MDMEWHAMPLAQCPRAPAQILLFLSKRCVRWSAFGADRRHSALGNRHDGAVIFHAREEDILVPESCPAPSMSEAS